jgi:hypothetical protein
MSIKTPDLFRILAIEKKGACKNAPFFVNNFQVFIDKVIRFLLFAEVKQIM